MRSMKMAQAWFCLFATAFVLRAQYFSISGTVAPPQGGAETIQNATVRLRYIDNPVVQETTVNPATAGFRFSPLADGPYKIIAFDPSDWYMPGCASLNLENSDIQGYKLRFLARASYPVPPQPLTDTKTGRPMANQRFRIIRICDDWKIPASTVETDGSGRISSFPIPVHGSEKNFQLLPVTPSSTANSGSANSQTDALCRNATDEAPGACDQDTTQAAPKPLRMDFETTKRRGIPLLLPVDEFHAKAWKVDLDTGVITPDVTLSAMDKFQLHLGRFTSLSSVFLPALVAAVNQKRNVPSDWGQGASGFGKRLASSYAYNTVVRNALGFALDSTLHLDPRYFPSSRQDGWGRLVDASVQTLLTRTDTGGRNFNFWRIGSAYGAGFISNAWYPRRDATPSDALIRGSLSLGLDTIANVTREFWPDVLNGPCGRVMGGISFAGECATKVLTNPNLHLALSSIAPGTGAGVGVVAEPYRRQSELVRTDVTVTAVTSFDGSYFAEASLRVTLGYGPRIVVLRKPQRRLRRPPARPSLVLYGRRSELHRQDFYGLGANTSLSGKAQYRERIDQFGAKIQIPFLRFFSLDPELALLRPHISPDVDHNGVRPLEEIYNEQTVPGISAQPLLLRFAPLVRFNAAEQLRAIPEIQAGYAMFQDLGSGRYSFDRLEIQSRKDFSLYRGSHKRVSEGFFISGRLSLSGTSAGNTVPFYLQQTLGGTDLKGDDTLRGYADYRFRGANLLLLQAEFRHQIWGPIGIIGFYDTGKVTALRSDMDFRHLRHDFGPGLSVNLANRTILRVYLGFGGHEGLHPQAKLPSAFPE
jgi:hypothetical protein